MYRCSYVHAYIQSLTSSIGKSMLIEMYPELKRTVVQPSSVLPADGDFQMRLRCFKSLIMS
jgi:hypothetical protein